MSTNCKSWSYNSLSWLQAGVRVVPSELVGRLPHPHPALHQNKLLVTQHRNPHKIALFHFILFAAGLLPLPWWELTSARQRLKPVGALVKPGSFGSHPQENLPQNSHRSFFCQNFSPVLFCRKKVSLSPHHDQHCIFPGYCHLL